MSDTPDKPPDEQWLRDLPIRTEEIGFVPEELVQCPKCAKRNGPNRQACLYCGAPIGEQDDSQLLEFRGLEEWENGFNLILGRRAEDPDRAAQILSSLIGADHSHLSDIFRNSSPVPVARVESAAAADSITERLSEHGVELTTVRDEDLSAKSPPLRLRTLEFRDNQCILKPFAGGEPISLDSEDLVLIFVGVFLTEKMESTERKKRRATKTLSESRTSSDDQFVDIYSRSNSSGWRIPSTGFDFSFLENEKSLLVAENITRLVARLCRFSPGAKVIDDYIRVRGMLEECWPTMQRKDSHNPKLLGFGSKDKKTVVTTDNSTQVTKYSRLQWYLL